jgi:hypothetical protein
LNNLIKFPGGARAIYRAEGLCRLYLGTTLALVGASNGALQLRCTKDEQLGFRAQAAEAREIRARVDDGGQQSGKDMCWC